MTAIFIQLTRDLYVIRVKQFSSSFLFEIHDTRQPRPGDFPLENCREKPWGRGWIREPPTSTSLQLPVSAGFA